MKKKNRSVKTQSAFGRMGHRISHKKDFELLTELNKKKKIFLSLPCKKTLTQKQGEGDKEKEIEVLTEGKTYALYDSGLNLGNGIKYWSIATMSGLNTVFFERHEIEEYFDLTSLEKNGYTLEDAIVMPGVSYDTSKLEDMKEE